MKNLIGVDINKNKISIDSATKKESYFCPTCGAPLIVRAENSTQVRKHFAHKRGTNCTDDWTYEMSDWHLAWQEKFPVESREFVMEADGEKHRADVFIYNTIIEFQHSRITYEDFTKRNKFYLKCGYQIVWIFDAKNMLQTPIEEILEPVSRKIRRNECKYIDCIERSFELKQYQNQFEEFKKTYPDGAPITIYLEVPLEDGSAPALIPLKEVAPISPKAHHFEPRITTNSFLKEYGVLNDSNVPSISDIIKNTRQMQIQLDPNRRNQVYYRQTYRPRRKGYL